MPNKFTKPERLKSRKLIQQLFGGGGKAVTAYPIRAVYTHITPVVGTQTDSKPHAEPAVQFGVSVPSRNFAKATVRNLLKRRMREAYRLQKQILYAALPPKTTSEQPVSLALMFIYIGKKEAPYRLIFEKTNQCLTRIAVLLTESNR